VRVEDGAATVTNGALNLTPYTRGRWGVEGLVPLWSWWGSWGLWARRASWWGACGRRRQAAPAVRARDGLAGGRNWGPRPGDALGDELRRRSGGQAGERARATAVPADGSSTGRP